MSLEVTKSDIEAAAERISPYVRRTPVVELDNIFDRGFRISLKLDQLQPTGSFKARGAFSLLTARDIPEAGVAAASGGNFGIAAAYACARLGYPVTIFVPATSPPEKIDRISEHGADVRVVPGYYDEAMAECEAWTRDTGAFNAHAYDQHEVVAGQGTSALEITAQLADVDTILVAVGGGGLIGGIASWCRDDFGVISTEPRNCRSMHAAMAAGGPTEVDVGGVASSSLGARSIGQHAWYASRWVDAAVLVSDEDIVRAQSWIWHNTKLVVEPAAATTVAALTTGAYKPENGEHVVAVISGANVDPSTIT